MDSDRLRLILLILGIVLIAVIYLWERFKTKSERKSARAALVEEHISEMQSAGQIDDEIQHDDEVLSRHLDELETIVRKTDTRSAKMAEPVTDRSIVAESSDDEDEEELGYEASAPQEPQEILMLSVVSRRKYFTGDAIMSAMRSVDLHPENNIFYRFTSDEQQTLYGVASMMEPGVFPLKDMSRFTTSGITLFAKLPGPRPGKRIFNDMYETAERLAAFLDGTIHDGKHNPLTDQELEHMREIAGEFSNASH